MTISLKQAPATELPVGQIFHRVQLTKSRPESVEINRISMPPAGHQAGRFCLKTGVTAYMADSPETALYEALFRREQKASVPLEALRMKSLASFKSHKTLKLIDLRGFEEKYPFLQSQRIQFTQAFSEECFTAGFDGIFYASAQHPHHVCTCLFESGAKKMRFINALPLVKPGSDLLLKEVVTAARCSAVEVV